MNKKIKYINILYITIFWLISAFTNAMADEDNHNEEDRVQFKDVTQETGVTYRRKESPRDEILDQFKQPGTFLTPLDIPNTPGNSRGNPGVAIYDYDNDGDMDIYVTNGPGAANSLYSNQLEQTGKLSFTDVADVAGVGAFMQDSAGVCVADTDNDGDKDLVVLGSSEANLFFENTGDGHYIDRTVESNIQGDNRNALGCSFGDINGDGLLDLTVANLNNSFENRLALMVPGFEHLKEHNQLYLNKGDNVFEDVSQSSGIEAVQEASWAIAMVDYDIDGDVDIVVADDQATRVPAKSGGEDFGYIRIFRNNGEGVFDDVTVESGMDRFGDWMGLAFGDLNGDENIDIFSSNIGDYLAAAVGPGLNLPTGKNEWSSRWFLGSENGEFTDPGIGDLGTSPFGWGSSMFDYDNDGDLDIVYHGGADMAIMIDATNPGVILNNDGNANFYYDKHALSASVNHSRRNVHGVAVGDLNNDGFSDIVSVSSMDWPEIFPLAPIVPPELLQNSQFDSVAYIWPVFRPYENNPDAGFVWNGLEPVDGGLSIEINSANNDNSWIKVKLVGMSGVLDYAKSNRDGIGATIRVISDEGEKVMTQPVVSGGSHASSDSFEKIFGIGDDDDDESTVEVIWPGGTKNKLYGVNAGEHLTMYEIPCSYDDKEMGRKKYAKCVSKSVKSLKKMGLIDKYDARRILSSALKAYAKGKR